MEIAIAIFVLFLFIAIPTWGTIAISRKFDVLSLKSVSAVFLYSWLIFIPPVFLLLVGFGSMENQRIAFVDLPILLIPATVIATIGGLYGIILHSIRIFIFKQKNKA